MTIWVSPAEPPELRTLGEYNAQVEAWGVDFVLFTNQGLVGVQRKTYADLIASLRGDRIGRELAQIVESPLTHVRFVVEGTDMNWLELNTKAGVRKYGRPVSRYELLGFVEMLAMRGIATVQTHNLAETAEYLLRLVNWMNDVTHVDRRLVVPKARGATTLERMLMQLPKVSLVKARRIADTFPRALRWGVTREELIGLDGFGAVTVDRMIGELR